MKKNYEVIREIEGKIYIHTPEPVTSIIAIKLVERLNQCSPNKSYKMRMINADQSNK